MRSIDFVRATSITEAVALLNAPALRCRVIAGGTDLVVAMRQDDSWFDRLVDISAIPEMLQIEATAGEVRIGAAVTFARAARDPLVTAAAPMLAQACTSVGSPQIRNTGTLGGNVVNAAVCADTLPPLVALDAQAHLIGKAGRRVLPVTQLVIAPHRTALSEGELLTHFSFPILPAGVRSTFAKLGRRNAQAISRLSVAAAGRLDRSGVVDFIRLATGAATPHTDRLSEVEDLLHGCRPSPDLLSAAAERVSQIMLNITGRRWSTEYKEIAIQGLVEQALSRVLGDAVPA